MQRKFNKSKNYLAVLVGILVLTLLWPAVTFAQKNQANLKPLIASVDNAKEGMSLWELIVAGGSLMIVLFLFSVVAAAIVIYNFMTLKQSKLLPQKFAEDVMLHLERGEKDKAMTLCKANDNILSAIVIAGLEKQKRGKLYAREAMENVARAKVTDLWQWISYLGDIATIAPLVGLLGTVLGMIQAFNVVAFQTAVVKPIMLAGGVSKAMVTTAAGLFVAIPALMFYSYFKAKTQQIINTIDDYTQDIIKIFEVI